MSTKPPARFFGHEHLDAALAEGRTITNWSKLGAALRDARLELGLTQAEAAASAGVSRSWLARVEAGHRSAELESLLKLFASLDLEMAIRPARRRSEAERPLTRRQLRTRERASQIATSASAGATDD